MPGVNSAGGGGGRLLATSDLHVSHKENLPLLNRLVPTSDEDWLLVAGDVAEDVADVETTLRVLSDRFAQVVWVPGNHELYAREGPRGQERYDELVASCRRMGVLTPEDPYPVWDGAGGPVTIAPLFLLYDYTFRPAGASTKEEALATAYAAGVVCTDEFLLHPDPHETRDDWCRQRVRETERRLAELDGQPTVLVNHYPLVREPTDVLWYPEFAQWCGTELTADWHLRFNARVVVYGHLHIPRTTHHDGVRFEEVSIGYPREWKRRGHPRGVINQVLFDEDVTG